MQKLPAPSAYQQAIIAELSAPGDHVVIRATAGAGKTTVLVQIARSQPEAASQLFLAFARDAALELGRRLPRTVDTRTVHSLGRLILASSLTSRDIELSPPQPAKYRRIASNLLKQELPALATPECAHYLAQLADMVRLRLLDPADQNTLRVQADEAGMWPPADPASVDKLFALLPRLLSEGLEQAERGLVDFGDMLFVPVRKGLAVPRFDLVCVDEAQDYSPLALELTLRLAAAGARLVFVGDPRQSIFGFAGADSLAMQRITDRLSAKVMPLAVTYRCPRLHVELARELAPEIEPAPGALPGSVQVVSEAELEQWVQPGDLIICRLNAPLIATCLRLIRLDLPASVRGADLKERLQRLAATVFARGIVEPVRQLRQHLDARLRTAAQPGSTVPGAAAGALRDETSCLLHLCGELPDRASLQDLTRLIDSAFGGRSGSVTLSSIHRAKGQEAERVILLYPELLPAPYARSLTALRGEACVQFVALTRAKQELVIVQADSTHSSPLEVRTDDSSADTERDRIIANWERVLSKARAGRRHRTAGPQLNTRQPTGRRSIRTGE